MAPDKPIPQNRAACPRMRNWKKVIILVGLAATLLLLAYDFGWKEAQGDLSAHHASANPAYITGTLRISNMRYDPQSRGAKGAVGADIQAADDKAEIKTIAFSPLSSDRRDWLLSVLHACRMTLGNVETSQKRTVSSATFDCDDMPAATTARRPEIWYPFDSYEAAFSPLGCVNNSGGACTIDDPGLAVSFDSIELKMADQSFAATLADDLATHSYRLKMQRKFFVRLVGVLFVVLSLVSASLVAAGDSNDVLLKAFAFFATLRGLRSLIVPPSITVFPTLVDYYILSIFSLLFWIVLLKLERSGFPARSAQTGNKGTEYEI